MKLDKDGIKFILISFLSWRIALFLLVALSILLFPLKNNFIGGGVENYLLNPLFWVWGNFDGEHYLSIAGNGYGLYEYAFFPFYPFLIKVLSLNRNLHTLNLTGIIISNLSFFVGLLGFYKLIKLDYKKEVAHNSILLLLLFPASFYFACVYTESLFFLFVVWSFYFAKKEKWFKAALLAMFAAITRNIGIILLPVLFVEYFSSRKWIISPLKKSVLWLFIIPVGFLIYLIYLNRVTGDPLAFISSLSAFGEQRSTNPIVLPQVFYRYIFKIIPNINFAYFPLVFTTLMELVVGIVYFVLALIMFFRMRLSYSLFFFLTYIIPTLSGSFSSLPRYVLISFPIYVMASQYLIKRNAPVRYLVFILSFLLLAISSMMFFRGYWFS